MRIQSTVSIALLAAVAACSHSATPETAAAPKAAPRTAAAAPAPAAAQAPAAKTGTDPRVGLAPGLSNAGQALENAKLMANAPSGDVFEKSTNSDLAFTGKYAVQGNYLGFKIYDVSNPAHPTLVSSVICPASQNDVSVYKQQLLFMSAEAPSARLDCGTQGVPDTVSKERIRGIRIFDISDIQHPKYITSVQTCRGSHTHSVLVDPKDPDNVYIYVSGSSTVRPEAELAGCQEGSTSDNPNTALFRVEIIQVPLAHPEQAKIASTSRLFENLNAVGFRHGDAPADIENARKALADAKAGHGFVITLNGTEEAMPPQMAAPLLDSIVRARGGTGGAAAATTADSAALRAALPRMNLAARQRQRPGQGLGPNQCHDVTLYPEIGLGGGACQGYGILFDIRDPLHPKRLNQVNDSNFAAWHSVTFSNDGSKILFSDEWGGGSNPKCRATDPKEWGADAVFTLDEQHNMKFQSYYKLSAPQTEFENCVAHNGSLIPIPDRDVMVQAWYQGGISIFDWTDPKHIKEIAYFDRGPVDTTRRANGGSWSAYWYNGAIFSSEIARGFDVVDLTPSEYISENELMAAKSVKWEYLNVQGQPRINFPPSFALACAYVDQLERNNGLPAAQISAARAALDRAQGSSGDDRRSTLSSLASQLNSQAASAGDGNKVRKLASAVSDLANGAQSAAPCSRKVS